MSSVDAPIRLADPDRIGVAASVLCAIHCALAPALLLFLPAFGRIWAHPASHALVALLIVPLAVLTIWSGYRRHRSTLVASAAVLGVFLIVVGAALPALCAAPEKEIPGACTDKCCPSTQISATGETTLHIPPAAIVTTLGGIALIAAHLGNLRSCRAYTTCKTAP